uniref:Uncharacterized protein n=1 Tax=Lactuca sativa TaxID=4236 RepID=A0A9R1UNH9_LACSA|nr:hypothetical protein LSAT_V11C800408060 [Lactuca sativa]
MTDSISYSRTKVEVGFEEQTEKLQAREANFRKREEILFLLNHILPLCPPDPFMRVERKHEQLNRVHPNVLHWTDVKWVFFAYLRTKY